MVTLPSTLTRAPERSHLIVYPNYCSIYMRAPELRLAMYRLPLRLGALLILIPLHVNTLLQRRLAQAQVLDCVL